MLEDRRVLSVFTVTTTADPAGPAGTVSLRQAITSANTNPGPDTINFNIPTSDGFNGEWWTIGLASRLPTLTDSGTTINGFSQPAAGTNTPVGTGGTVGVDEVPFPQFQQPEIAIDANHPANPNPEALIIGGNASNILIRGMAVYDAGLLASSDSDVAIQSQGGSGVNRVIESMFIGVLPDGSDPGLAERNIGFGVRQLTGGRVTVTKSYVGFNGRGGLDAGITSNNVIFTYNEVFQSGWASTAHDGIDINGRDSIARYNLSRDNTNMTMIPNGGSGTGIELGSQATPGTGNNIVENNTISGNLSAGISARAGASLNTIRKNVIFDNEVGISVNTEAGSVANHTYRNQISQNSIYMNMGLGIDLQHQVTDAVQWVGSPDGGNDTEVTGQDHLGCDADNGSNDLQNYPIISSVLAIGGSTTVEGTLISTPLTTFTLEFFSTPDGTLFTLGDREGKDFIGSIEVTTDAACTATFNHTFSTAVGDDDAITATATKFTVANTPWSTSEFSPAVPVAEITLQEKVTGGGWYNQPVTATPPPSTQDDRANFGFNAKYKKDNPVPQGVTNFRYRPDDLHFLSTSYAPLSLIVTETSPDVHRATWRGLGKVNNVSGFGFRADVTDAGEPGTSDTFHIKIWQEVDQDPFTEEPLVVYDNDPTSTGTVLGGGNIQVHMRPNALQATIAGDSDAMSLLTEEALEDAVAQAIAWWRGEGVEEPALALLADAQVLVATLPDQFLGVAANGVIGLDRDAAGHGWSIDASLAGGVDLATVVIHEFGHLLDFEHDDSGVMEETLAPSGRPGSRLNGLPQNSPVPTVFAALDSLSDSSPVSMPGEPRSLPAEAPADVPNAMIDLTDRRLGDSPERLASIAWLNFNFGVAAPPNVMTADIPGISQPAPTSGAAVLPAPRFWSSADADDRALRSLAPAVMEIDAEMSDAEALSAPTSWRQACDACFADEFGTGGEEMGQFADLPFLAALAALVAGGWQMSLAKSESAPRADRSPERLRLRKGI